MTLLVEQLPTLPVTKPDVPNVPQDTQDVTHALSAVAISRVGVAPKTSEELQRGLRESAHQVGFTAIAQMLRKEDDGRWL